MKYRALATDYDGTIAHDGRVDQMTLHALEDARATGLRLVLVTGRELSDLSNAFADTALFDRVVAENGAVLLQPATSSVRLLAPPCPPALIEKLAQRHIPLSVGHSIVATVEPHHRQVLAAIRELGLDWHIVFNKGSVMALPAGVTKATGLVSALEELEVTADQTVGVGDAENDQDLLAACGLAVAVANALPSVKQIAHLVTKSENGAGVVELLENLRSGRLDAVEGRRAGSSRKP
jgi:hydroxymethylpyrimidine pyrophosphatase-like HAD family hydrolase